MILQRIADLFFPRVCLCCGKDLEPDEKHLCAGCMKDLPLTRYWKLRNNPMSDSFNALIQRQMGSDIQYTPYGYAAALFFYRGGFRAITKALKYKRNFAAGVFFAKLLGKALSESDLFRDVDLVVPIPLHWTRRWRRGYNQAETIAREVAAQLGVPCKTDLLRRVRHTKTQTRLDSERRASNVSGAFRINKSPVWTGAEGKPPEGPKHILLIDDVFTTGATAAACESALRNMGRRVSIATLACVEH
jgi:ComF family protein